MFTLDVHHGSVMSSTNNGYSITQADGAGPLTPIVPYAKTEGQDGLSGSSIDIRVASLTMHTSHWTGHIMWSHPARKYNPPRSLVITGTIMGSDIRVLVSPI